MCVCVCVCVCVCIRKELERGEKSLCVKLEGLFKNKTDIISSSADSQDLPEKLPSHFVYFNAEKTNTS